jgi:two-component system, cell cycle sensor histidine kinase and response regulator CckA
VKQNGGFVWVNSEPGLGTTFKFFLPQVQSLSSEIAITKPVESSPRGCETLLLVEDEASVRHASRQFLIRNGHTVLEATHGEDEIRASQEPAARFTCWSRMW